MKQSRWRSWAAWVLLLPIIVLLGDTYGLWDIIHMPQDTFTKLFMAIGAAGTAFGVFNNPTSKNQF